MPAETPTNDAKKVAGTAKGTAQAAKGAKTTIQAVSTIAKGGSGPVGWIMLAKQFAPQIRKLQSQLKKAAAAAAALILYLLYLLWLKMMGLLSGLAFGVITGLPLLAIPVAGPFLYAGWVGFWGYRGLTHPEATIHLATHPWEIISKPWGYIQDKIANFGQAAEGGFQYAGSGLSHGITNTLGTASSWITGAASTVWNGAVSLAGNVLSFAGSLANGALGLFSGGGASVSTLPLSQVAVGGAVGTIATATVVAGIMTNATFFTPESDPGSVEPPGVNQNYTLTKTAQPPSISGIGPQTNITFTVKVQAKSKTILSIGFIENFRYQKGGVETRLKDPPITVSTPIPPGESREAVFTLNTLSAELPDGSFVTIPGDSLVINGVVSNATMDDGSNQIENVSVTVPIGSPPTNCPTRWPVTGFITQGPDGGTSHADEIYGGYEALDIGAPVGTTVYNTVDGVVDYTDDSRGTLDQRVGVIPNSCPNLGIIHYWHLSGMAVTPGQSVSATTTIIGASGHSAPHLHYQFNNTGERGFRQEPPNIPTAVPRTCNGDCSITTTAP